MSVIWIGRSFFVVFWLCTGSVVGSKCSSNVDVGKDSDHPGSGLWAQVFYNTGVAQDLGLGPSVSYLVMQRRGNAKNNIDVHHISCCGALAGQAPVPPRTGHGEVHAAPPRRVDGRSTQGWPLRTTCPRCGSSYTSLSPSGAAPATINAVTQVCPPRRTPGRVDPVRVCGCPDPKYRLGEGKWIESGRKGVGGLAGSGGVS